MKIYLSHRVGEIGEIEFDKWCIINHLDAWRAIDSHSRIDRIILTSNGYKKIHIKAATFSRKHNRYVFKSNTDRETEFADYWFLVGIGDSMEINFKIIVPFDKFGKNNAVVIRASNISEFLKYSDVPSELL